MSETKTDYSKVTLDPSKMVEVPINIWSTLFNVVKKLNERENKAVVEYVYSYFHKKTNKKLSNSGKSKISKEKLEKDYYRNLDIDASKENIKLQTEQTSLGMVSFELLAAFDEVFKNNVDNGNVLVKENQIPQTNGS